MSVTYKRLAAAEARVARSPLGEKTRALRQLRSAMTKALKLDVKRCLASGSDRSARLIDKRREL